MLCTFLWGKEKENGRYKIVGQSRQANLLNDERRKADGDWNWEKKKNQWVDEKKK